MGCLGWVGPFFYFRRKAVSIRRLVCAVTWEVVRAQTEHGEARSDAGRIGQPAEGRLRVWPSPGRPRTDSLLIART